jgi:ferric iron reductase protein FhuF
VTHPSNADLLAKVTDLVPFMRWRVGEPEAGELVAQSLAADPDALAAAVAATAPGRGTDDPQVAASLWWQSYSYRVAGTTLATWVVTGAAPDPAAPGTAVGTSRHRPSAVVYDPAAATIDDLAVLVDRLLAGNLDPVADALRARHALGQSLVRGNTAAGVESALGAVVTADGAPPLMDRVAAVRDALPDDVKTTVVVNPDGHRRRTCCLWWKTTESAGRLCADCSLLDKPLSERRP